MICKHIIGQGCTCSSAQQQRKMLNMNRNLKGIILCVLLVVTVFFVTACGKTETPYKTNNAENYTVSVKYDASGGTFTTNTSVIVDSYNLSQVGTNGEGKAQIALIPPESEQRGKNAFTAVNNGYFLAGWYQERTETAAADGSVQYTYAGKWDFESDRLNLDPAGNYSAEEPVITLYAAWIPLFQIEYYDLATGELLTAVSYNPVQDGQIELPQWNETTGAIDMKDIPAKEGYTYQALYLDAEGKQAVDAAALDHTGAVEYATATATDASMKLYVDWTEGQWYRIYTAEQFAKNASLNGCYEICADLDFSEDVWPTVMMYGSFTGTINGNGHTISNVVLEQTNNSKTAAGLFGQIAETAVIRDLSFDKVDFTIKAGTRVAGTSYGLLAGVISEKAQFSGLQIQNSLLKIDSDCYFATDDYTIGLVCGMGAAPVAADGITCEATGSNPESIVVTATGDTVTVTPAA